MTFCKLDIQEQISAKFESNVFIEENVFENVFSDTVTILYRPQCFNI